MYQLGYECGISDISCKTTRIFLVYSRCVYSMYFGFIDVLLFTVNHIIFTASKYGDIKRLTF